MDKKQKNIVLRELQYDVSRKYFGDFTYGALYDVYHVFKHTQAHDKPIVSQRFRIGRIDGEVICRALYKQMSYNPKRFGNKSPFLHNGRENIFYFCSSELSPLTPGYNVLVKVQDFLKEFMFANSKHNGQWSSELKTKDGFVTISFTNMYADKNYKKLAILRNALKEIIKQNMVDFKSPAYRAEIIRAVMEHENGKNTITAKQTIMDELKEDRMDKAEENAQITADNVQYFSNDQYNQARAVLNRIAEERTLLKTK